MSSVLAWTEEHAKKYKLLFNYIITLDEYKEKQLKPYNYLLKSNKRTLINIIRNNTNWGDSSMESIYFNGSNMASD